MLSFSLGRSRDCQSPTRRSFLQIGALAGLGVSLPLALSTRTAHAAAAKATNCILIWTQGGTSHHDTFDPKPNAPVSVKGEFGVIDTAVPGVQFTDILPTFAKELKRYGLLRGWNPKNGSHGTADQYVMSGRNFNQAIHYPCYGSVSSYFHGFKSALPPFVQLGNAIDHRFGGGQGGVLGLTHNPFEISADPNAEKFSVRDITPPAGITAERLDKRRKMISEVDALQRAADLQPEAYNALDKHYQTAFNIITAPETKKVFELSEESPELRDAYGRNKFGQSCLLARRLIEAGVRFVTLTDGGWDTHANNFKALKDSRIPPLDKGLPQLLIDLENHGLLATTLVIWLTDFGRTPKINSASGRDHWANTGFAIMAGAGIPGGSVVGATDDNGGLVAKDEYMSEDIACTVYSKLGIPIDLIATSVDGRPVRLIEGQTIKQWM